MFPPFAERLARAGLSAVSVNLSGSGVDDAGEFVYPERFGHNTYSAELDDGPGWWMRSRAAARRRSAQVASGWWGTRGAAASACSRRPKIAGSPRWRPGPPSAASSAGRRSSGRWREAGVKEIVNTRTGQRLPLYPDVLDDIERHAAGRLDILGAAGAGRGSLAHRARHRGRVVSSLEGEALHAAAKGASPATCPSPGRGTPSARCIPGAATPRPFASSRTRRSASSRPTWPDRWIVRDVRWHGSTASSPW